MNWKAQQEQLRACNLEWIRELKVPVEEKGSQVSVKILGRRIDFWPFSDTYFLHSKNIYGTNIPELCRKIKSAIEKSASDKSD